MMELYQGSGAIGLTLVAIHFILAAAFWKMAERTKVEPRWFALVPFLNIIIFLRLAGRPVWWLVLFLVPFVNIITLVVVTMSLCERFGVNKWWGLASLVSPVNLGLYLYLAYGTPELAVIASVPQHEDKNLLSEQNRVGTFMALVYLAAFILLIFASGFIGKLITYAIFQGRTSSLN